MKSELGISIDEVRELMKGEQPLFFIHVRQHRERDWTVVKVRGALRVPDDEVERYLDEIPRDHPIIVYSATTGEEPAIAAAELLLQRGWQNVHVLRGGLSAYLEAGLPVDEIDTGSVARRIMFID